MTGAVNGRRRFLFLNPLFHKKGEIMVTTPPTEKTGSTIRLKNGRVLGYAEYGSPGGKPVLYFPGVPSSRLLHPPEEPARRIGVRIIAVERPGYGLSDNQKGRRLCDWPGDVSEFADGLGIERCPVIGTSGGGPYALACAWQMPDRVTRAAVVSGVGPTDLPGFVEEMPSIRRMGAVIARKAPWLLPLALGLFMNPRHNPEKFFQNMVSGNSEADRRLLNRPEMKAMLIGNYQEATRRSMQGFARDSIILSNPWGFQPEDIRVPVGLWHGEDDANVSISAARYLATAIPGCQAHFVPGEGHWLILEHFQEILEWLMDGS